MTASIGVAAVVAMAAAMPLSVSTVSPAARLSADSTALMLGGTSIPTWNDADVEVIMRQFITPTHPGQTIEPVAVTTPEELWPGGRWVGPLVCLALCPTSVFGPGGSGWLPDEPLWKLSGLFDLTFDQSVQAGVTDLEAAMADHGNDNLVIYGYSQGAVVANVEKRGLAQQYPDGTEAPDVDFVLGGDLNLPNGGFFARFPGLYIPILDFSFNGPAATDTQFDTVEINRQYDFMSDFPLYPINVIADLNALLGFFYVHIYPFDVSLAPDASTSPVYQGKYGDTSYYLFETQDLPLFAPLRMLGVPEPLIDVVEPFFRVLVELGFDRSIPPWEPTPARLIPPLNPGKVATDLLNAIGEGVNNAAAIFGSPPLLSIPAPATQTAKADLSLNVMSSSTPAQIEEATVDGDPSTAGDVDRDGGGTNQVTPADMPAQTQEMSSAPATTSQSSTTARPEPSAIASTSKPAKPRPLVRNSLRADPQVPERSHGGEGNLSTTQTAAVGTEAATGESSSTASSSAAASSTGSSPGGASSGNSDGS